jgi:hypothetical protein
MVGIDLVKHKSPCFFSPIDSILPSYMTTGNNSYIMKHSKQHRSSTTSESNIKKINKRSNENCYEQTAKRIRPDNELQSTLNVFDIFNQSDQIILDDNE